MDIIFLQNRILLILFLSAVFVVMLAAWYYTVQTDVREYHIQFMWIQISPLRSFSEKLLLIQKLSKRDLSQFTCVNTVGPQKPVELELFSRPDGLSSSLSDHYLPDTTAQAPENSRRPPRAHGSVTGQLWGYILQITQTHTHYSTSGPFDPFTALSGI